MLSCPLLPNLKIYLHSMHRDGIALKKMPISRDLALPGVTEASGLDVSIQELSMYVADAEQGSVDVLKLSGPRSRQGLTPTGQVLKLRVGLIITLFKGVLDLRYNPVWSCLKRDAFIIHYITFQNISDNRQFQAGLTK